DKRSPILTTKSTSIAAMAAVTLLGAGCGGGKSLGTASGPTRAPAVAKAIPLPAGAQAAERVSAAEFPAPRGRSLEQLAATLKAGPKLGLASSVLLVGPQRFAFGL